MVSKKELLKNEEALNKQIQTVFSFYDKDSSNFIERGELRKPLEDFMKTLDVSAEDLPEGTLEKAVEDTLASLDVNHDGKLSLEEFKDFILKLIKNVSIQDLLKD